MPTDTPRLTASEALYAFMGWLTSRHQAVTLGASHEAATAAELVNEFCTVNNLTEPREDFHTRFARPPEVQPTATPQPGERPDDLADLLDALADFERDEAPATAATLERASVMLRTLTRELAEVRAEVAKAKEFAGLLALVEHEHLDLRCVDVPTGGDDSDVAWVVIEHYMAEPREREIGRGHTPLAALRAAIAPAQEANASA